MRKKKKTFQKPVVIGLFVIYLATMLLSTYLVKEKFTQEYAQSFKEEAKSLLQEVTEYVFRAQEEGNNVQEQKVGIQALLADFLREGNDGHVQMSAAVYDAEKELLVKNEELFGLYLQREDTESWSFVTFGLDENLTLEERKELAVYVQKTLLAREDGMPPEYRIFARTSLDGQELREILVQKVTWIKEEEWDEDANRYVDPLTGSAESRLCGVKIDYATGQEKEGEEYIETDSQVVWKWTNPQEQEGERGEGLTNQVSASFPYLSGNDNGAGRNGCKANFFRIFPQQGEFFWEKGTEEPLPQVVSDGLYYRSCYKLKVGMIDDPSGYLEVRMESCPWAAAVDYMKYLYIWGLVLILVCMGKIIYVFNKTYEKQAALEETRRDFTNAIAHELKTPLAVIRNFAENLLEHNMEEKRDYYLKQIIGQTEDMDHLVVEMIEISRLDSQELVLKKETVSFLELIREQMERFEPMLKEKNIETEILGEKDFWAEGDREYLARAVWNLLSNAVSYNIPDGRIRIKMEAGSCTIENTGQPMEEEQLCHAFDLFYTGNESRSGKERHMGMGLFLTKKILELHGLGLTVENGGDGVRAIIWK